MPLDAAVDRLAQAAPGWELPAGFPVLTAGEQHVWLVELNGIPDERVMSSLSSDEASRAGAFRFDLHRNQFVNCRAALRSLLGRYLDVESREIALETGPNGKPRLAERHRGSLHFNVSHSGDYALIAFSRDEVGADIERHDPRFIEPGTMDICFSAREKRTFEILDEADRVRGFFDTWTAKEAYLKLAGVGLAVEPRLIDLNCSRNALTTARVGEHDIWFNRLPEIPGYSHAVASYNGPLAIRSLKFLG